MEQGRPLVIEAEELTRRFGRILAVDQVSFTADKGRIFGLLGENGAGKTTIVHLLTGLLIPTAGRVRVLGLDPGRRPRGLRRLLGYVPQRVQLTPGLALADQVRLFSDAKNVQHLKAERSFGELARRLGFADDLQRLPEQLPAGVQKRAALALALMLEPELLLCDEATVGVDLYDRLLFFELFHELTQRGTSVFLTTHRPEEVESCHRVAFLHRARLLCAGAPADLKVQHSGGWPIRIESEPGKQMDRAGLSRRLEAEGYRAGGAPEHLTVLVNNRAALPEVARLCTDFYAVARIELPSLEQVFEETLRREPG